jgi:hypothetical protein
MVLFAAADFQVYPKFDFIGITVFICQRICLIPSTIPLSPFFPLPRHHLGLR